MHFSSCFTAHGKVEHNFSKNWKSESFVKYYKTAAKISKSEKPAKFQTSSGKLKTMFPSQK
jgi:hypothetical protein